MSVMPGTSKLGQFGEMEMDAISDYKGLRYYNVTNLSSSDTLILETGCLSTEDGLLKGLNPNSDRDKEELKILISKLDIWLGKAFTTKGSSEVVCDFMTSDGDMITIADGQRFKWKLNAYIEYVCTFYDTTGYAQWLLMALSGWSLRQYIK